MRTPPENGLSGHVARHAEQAIVESRLSVNAPSGDPPPPLERWPFTVETWQVPLGYGIDLDYFARLKIGGPAPLPFEAEIVVRDRHESTYGRGRETRLSPVKSPLFFQIATFHLAAALTTMLREAGLPEPVLPFDELAFTVPQDGELVFEGSAGPGRSVNVNRVQPRPDLSRPNQPQNANQRRRGRKKRR